MHEYFNIWKPINVIKHKNGLKDLSDHLHRHRKTNFNKILNAFMISVLDNVGQWLTGNISQHNKNSI